MPKISVIFPVYNGTEYLLDAINSVLTQSYVDFELIIINDGSTDDSVAIIEKLKDPRIRFYQQSNKGLAATLNRGISLAKGEYIARQDQDDLSFPSRFERQINFLEANQDVGIVGTDAEIWVDNSRTTRLLNHPSQNVLLKFALLFDNHFVHSSVMIRRSVFDRVGCYAEDSSRQPPEDYELWSRLMKEYKLANLPEVLVAYREVEGSMSRTGQSPFLRNLITISAENVAWASGRSAEATAIIALSRLIHGVYENIPSGVRFAEMRNVLIVSAYKIAVDAGSTPAQLDRVLRERIHKLRYHYMNYHCFGLVGKIVNSKGLGYLKKFAKQILYLTHR